MSTTTDRYELQQSAIEACCRQLIAEGITEPLSTDEGDTKVWMLRDLASLVEGHLHVQLDVTRLSEEDRLAYERRVSYDGRPLASPHGEYYRPFWLLAGVRRVGTIAIGTMYYGSDLISIASLYVDPAERRRNIARRALEGVFRAALAKVPEVSGSTRIGPDRRLCASMLESGCGSGCGNTTWSSPGSLAQEGRRVPRRRMHRERSD